MNNYWFFGCSHTTSTFNFVSKDNCWTRLLAQSFGYNEINLAAPGLSNDAIFNKVLDNLPNFKSTDKVFILLTFPERLYINKRNILPSDPSHSIYYKTINDDDFFATKLIQIILSLKLLLQNVDYHISYVDPSLILKHMVNIRIKELLKDQRTILLPKLTLSNSFELGADHKHLSTQGHLQFFRFLSGHLANQSD